jgi:uncharacterized membrane protein
MTEPQRRLLRQIDDLVATAVRLARRSERWRREGEEAGQRLDHLQGAHPDYVQADVRQRIRFWLSDLALAGAVSLDAILTAPVAEHLLLTYAHVTAMMASVGRFMAPLCLILVELAIGMTCRSAARDRRWGNAALWATLGALPVAVMPLLVGETEMVAAAVQQAEATGTAVSEAGLLTGSVPLFTLAMMLWTAFIHAYVVFGPHDEGVSYAAWSVRASWLTATKRNAEERARSDANAAGDRFSQYVARRDEWMRTYPDWPPPAPNWSEAPGVLERVFGYPVITGPGVHTNATVQIAPPLSTPEPPAPPGRGDAMPPAGDAGDHAVEPDAAELHRIAERRVRESDAAVSV